MTGLLGRKCLAVLAVLGLIAALLAVNPRQATADADNPDVDNPAEYSACVGAAAADAGFEDVEGISGEDAINCLAHYNIAQGRTETMFSPRETISRWQMALFLSRAAGPAGVILPASPPDNGFTDIGALSEDAQAAANNLADLGIMPGTSATTFSPNTSVTRGSMATMLDAFLSKAARGEGGADTTKLSPDDNVFTDITNAPRNQYIAIRRVYELGITKGVTETLYRPTQAVTREQMALFISRTLAHTVARPAGLSIQSAKDTATGSGADGTDGEEITFIISARNDEFQALTDVPVDVFTSTDPDTAFKEDGTCDTGTTMRGGVRKCEVDGNDERTGAEGDLAISVSVDADTTVWAWTGDDGDKYDNDETTSAMLEMAFQKGATRLLVSHDLDDDQTKMKFGRTVKVTIQVADEDNNPVAKEDVELTISQTVTSSAKSGQTAGSNSSTNSQKTDASGKIELSFTQNDPTVGNNSDSDATVVLIITDRTATDDIKLKDGEGEDPGAMEDPPAQGAVDMRSNDGMVRLNDEGGTSVRMGLAWSDDDAIPANHTFKLSQRDEYTIASDEGSGAGSSVTATVINEYGEPVGGVAIVFDSNDEDGIPALAENRRTGATGARSGARRLAWTRDSTDGGIETIFGTTSVVTQNGECRDTADDCSEDDDVVLAIGENDDGAIVHYWPAKADDATDADEKDIIVIRDAENNTIVFKTIKGECADDRKAMDEEDDTATMDHDESTECTETDDTSSIAVYDDNDHFTVGTQPVTMEDFEKELDAKNDDGDPKYDMIELVNYSDTASEVSSFTITESMTSAPTS